jgi:hypothetical protein
MMPAVASGQHNPDNGWRPGVIDALDVVAEIAVSTGKYERAVRLIAAAQKERTTLGLV